MRFGYLSLCSASVVALAATPASAKILTVNVTAHVVRVDDAGNVLGGGVAIGDTASGSYSYETTVPNSDTYPRSGEDSGQYMQSPTQGSASLNVGPYTFASDPTSWSWTFEAMVFVSYVYNWDSFRVLSMANKPLPGGENVSSIEFDFGDSSGLTLNSAALLTTAPTRFANHSIDIFGSTPAGGYFEIALEIDSVETANPGISVSPATGTFVRQQHIDPAVFPEASTELIGSLQANVNGIPMSSFSLWQCSFAPNSQNRPAIVCPDINWNLPAGKNHVEWNVQLTDGSVLTKTVDWEILE